MLALVLTVLVGALPAAARWHLGFPRWSRRRRAPFAKDASGEVVIADTREWWAERRRGIDRDIQEELDSSPHRGGQGTWNDAWLESLVTNSRGVEHSSRYVAYIIKARRKAGLPGGYAGMGPGDVDAGMGSAHRQSHDHLRCGCRPLRRLHPSGRARRLRPVRRSRRRGDRNSGPHRWR